MMNYWRFLLAASFCVSANLGLAQSATPSASPSPADKKKEGPRGSTVITATQEATFDQKANVAVFLGEVKVVDPQFTLTCNKLTVFMRHDDAPPKKGAPSPSPKPTPTPANSKTASQGPQEGGGIDHAVAEGNVVIRQEKPGENGGPPTVNIGKSRRALFNNLTGEVTMRGWPQLQQGISTHIAMAETTIMYLDNGGKLKTDGPSRTVIQDQPDTTPSPSPSASPRASLLPLGGGLQ